MDEQLISKKELLELTGISYGQLYRWKRKDLIPEEWFIRKSTFTGQETFFPKAKILARIDKIIDMKDNLSLNELADMFSPNLAEMALHKSDIINRGIVSTMALQYFTDQTGDADAFTFERLIHMYVLDRMLHTGEMSLEEGKGLLQVLRDHYQRFEGRSCELMLVRKMGVSIFLLSASPGEVYFDNGTKLVSHISLASCLEELKAKLT
ncbi:YhbD family protein [Paenibacillus sp. MER TA 81-3]|uniref:YhbD family protein n=1 Tax=Paenibacillus sp. MER TA 81-3 TaxID=2939573 RepID=UPI00203B4E69|nr:YhbD family protein [Paenibacillus sp. MER TA 81-3]MCM3341448.1 YhbD family protein [Paenibacillus sp. MER TA 81-3]